MTADREMDGGDRLWAERCLTGGQLVITRPEPGRRDTPVRRLLSRAARLVLARRRTRTEAPGPRSWSPEETLALTDTTEARVAAAASRAWLETVHEPAWSSPHLAHVRAGVDGWGRVDQIIDLALRVYRARVRLGVRPSGPAGEFWDRQHAALEQAAEQLGERADALIRFRDQTGRLSAELRLLTELEHVETTAVEIGDLTVETASHPPPADGGLSDVTDEIAGVRAGMTELLDLMTRTLAPLGTPPPELPASR